MLYLFAVGSVLFAYLLLRGRFILFALAWLSLRASILFVVGLPAQLANLINSALTSLMGVPMLAFETSLGFWLIITGVSKTRRSRDGLTRILADG